MSFIDELKRLHEAAMEAPWSVYDDSNDGKTKRMEIVAIGKTVAHIYRSVPAVDGPNAALIALLRNHAAEIIALVEAAKELLDASECYCLDEPEKTIKGECATCVLREALAALESGNG